MLATVANTINDFSERHGNHFIYARGSTPSRTRLYQISISNLLNEIKPNFDVYGLKNGVIFPFHKNENYDAFLVRKK